MVDHLDICSSIELARKVRELELQVSELRSAMNRYATHFDDCKPPCSCGLDTVLADKPNPECTCSIDGTPYCKARGTGYCFAEKREASSSMNPPEAFVVQLCHGDKADGLYYDGDGDWTNFENACTYYSHHDMDEVLKEARQANEDKIAEVVAFSVILSSR